MKFNYSVFHRVQQSLNVTADVCLDMAFSLLYVIASWTLAAFIPVLIIYLICALIQVTSLKNCIIVPSRQGQTQINILTFVDSLASLQFA